MIEIPPVKDSSRSSYSRSDPRLAFVTGVLPRSGTHLVGRALIAHPEVVRPTGHWEIPLLKSSPAFDRFHRDFLAHRPPGILDYTRDEFSEAFGYGFVRALARRCPDLDGSTRFIVQKSVSTVGIKNFEAFFPDGYQIVLIRDGRDVASSTLAKMGRTRFSPWRLRLVAGRARAWASSAKRIHEYFEGRPERSLLLRFEDLVANPAEHYRKLGDFLGLQEIEPWVTRATEIAVRGSSFFRPDRSEGDPIEQAGGAHWREIEKTPRFQPVGRWTSFLRPLEQMLFKWVAGPELARFGYSWKD